MSKHTPVTWFVDIEGNRILANDDRATIICHMSATVRNPEVMADANLIAAAPETEAERDKLRIINAELLDALETLRGVSLVIGQSRAEKIVAANAKADKAIAKAKGESA